LEDERLRLEQELTARQETLTQHQQLICEQARTLEELHSLVAELKRMLFGPKSEKLSEEQAAELAEVVGDLTDQTQRPNTDSEELLQEVTPEEGSGQEKEPPPRRRRRARQMPVDLEVQTTILEPTDPPPADGPVD